MKALLIILLVLTGILLIPLGIDGGYREKTFILGVKIGPVNLKILPMSDKGFLAKMLKTEKKPRTKKAGQKPEKPEEEKKTWSFEEILDIIRIGLGALGRFRRRLNIDYLRIWCSVSASDPFDTAMRYGIIRAAVAAYYPLIDGAFNVKERDYSVTPDFISGKTKVEVWLTTTINLLDLFYIAIAFGIDYLKLRKKQKRLPKTSN